MILFAQESGISSLFSFMTVPRIGHLTSKFTVFVEEKVVCGGRCCLCKLLSPLGNGLVTCH